MTTGLDRLPVLMRVSDWFLPTGSVDGESLTRRGRMFLAFHGMGAAVLLWTAFYQLAFGWKPLGLVSLGLLPLAFVAPLAMKLGASIGVLTSISVWLFYALSMGISVSTAGVWPGGPLFLLLTPAVAVLLVDRSSGLRWSVVTIASLIYVGSVREPAAGLDTILLQPEAIGAAQLRISGMISIAVFAMAYFYSKLNDRAQQALEESARAHQRGEDRFRAIAEHAYDLIAELDENAVVTFASPGFESVLGWDPAEMEGHRIDERIHPDDRARAHAYWCELLENSSVKQDAIRFESVGRGWRWLEISLRCYENTEVGRRVVAVVRDSTERLEREKMIRHQQNLVMIGTIATGVGQQLSNPISSILASAQYGNMFKWNPNFGDIAGESLDSIAEEARNSERILRALVSFAKQEPSARWVDSVELVLRRAIAAVESQRSTLDAEIVLIACREATRVLMGPIEIEQAIINVLRNALEAQATVVRVTTEIRGGETVCITVCDDGSGLSDESRKRAFEPFYTTRSDSGSGLGLSVARKIFEDHGGRLNLVETSSEGSVFEIELPLATVEEEK